MRIPVSDINFITKVYAKTLAVTSLNFRIKYRNLGHIFTFFCHYILRCTILCQQPRNHPCSGLIYFLPGEKNMASFFADIRDVLFLSYLTYYNRLLSRSCIERPSGKNVGTAHEIIRDSICTEYCARSCSSSSNIPPKV